MSRRTNDAAGPRVAPPHIRAALDRAAHAAAARAVTAAPFIVGGDVPAHVRHTFDRAVHVNDRRAEDARAAPHPALAPSAALKLRGGM